MAVDLLTVCAVLGRFRSVHRDRELRPGRLLVPLLLCLQVHLPPLALSPCLPVSSNAGLHLHPPRSVKDFVQILTWIGVPSSSSDLSSSSGSLSLPSGEF